jgi:hypothetical protein
MLAVVVYTVNAPMGRRQRVEAVRDRRFTAGGGGNLNTRRWSELLVNVNQYSLLENRGSSSPLY